MIFTVLSERYAIMLLLFVQAETCCHLILACFFREVIDRRPEEFKIAALTDLKECFPVKRPFYAGFGNRETVRFQVLVIFSERIKIQDTKFYF